ncbi:MAG: calcium/sodium antiporter [Lachnospiraceae bacterium]|nr:calcium/sodium antiporter [Lachnospiraceae bacterium]
MDILLQLVLVVVGFVMLVKGADWFVDGAAGIAERFGIPQLVIGLTIVAMGTSAPEAAVSISAAFKGTADITVGNVVGSNILNILIILGLTAVIVAVPVQVSTVRYEIPFMILITGVLLVLGLTGNEIGRVEGGIFWVLFILYLLYLLRMTKNQKTQEAEEEKKSEKGNVGSLLLLLIIGIVLVVLGSDVAVDAATELAKIVGLSEKFIGLTVIALGTSLPELVTSVAAARKGKADIAIGNIVGSNIVNILFVVGTTALITPVPFAADFTNWTGFSVDMLVAIVAAVLLLICVLKKKKLVRSHGVIMLLVYAAYFVYLLIGK